MLSCLFLGDLLASSLLLTASLLGSLLLATGLLGDLLGGLGLGSLGLGSNLLAGHFDEEFFGRVFERGVKTLVELFDKKRKFRMDEWKMFSVRIIVSRIEKMLFVSR